MDSPSSSDHLTSYGPSQVIQELLGFNVVAWPQKEPLTSVMTTERPICSELVQTSSAISRMSDLWYSPTVAVYEDHFQLLVSQQRLQELVEHVFGQTPVQVRSQRHLLLCCPLACPSYIRLSAAGCKSRMHTSIALHVEAMGHNIKWDCFEILASRKTDYLSKIKESFFIQELNPNPRYYIIYF